MKRIALICILMVCVNLFAIIIDPFGPITMYNTQTTLVCRVTVNGAAASSNDILMVAVGNEIRGKAQLQMIGTMPGEVGRNFGVQGNNPTETFNFYLWERATQRVLTTTFTITANPGEIIGGYFIVPFGTYTVSITGHVYLANSSTGVAGIQFNIISATPAYNSSFYNAPITNANGEYIIPGITAGSRMKFEPVDQRYFFTPAYYEYTTGINLNQTATFYATELPTHNVTGIIVDTNDNPVSNVLVYTNPYTSVQYSTYDSGVFLVPLVHGTSTAIVPSKLGWTFSPTLRDVPVITTDVNLPPFVGYPQTFTVYGNTSQPEATVSYTSLHAPPGSVMSDDNGNYEINYVVYGDTLTVTPQKAGFTFSPTSRTIPNITQDRFNVNFTSIITTYTVSGNVKHNGANLSGVAIRIGLDTVATTNAQGNYSFIRPHGDAFTFYPEMNGFEFSPTSVPITELVANETHNFTATAIPQHQVTVSVTVPPYSTPLPGVTITHAITGGATGSDTTDSNGEVTFTLNQTTQNITFTPYHPAYDFTPPYHTQTGLTAPEDISFSATPKTFTITGNAGLPGVTINISGGLGSVTTGSNGTFTIPDIGYDTSLVLTPTLDGYTFVPPSLPIDNITDDVNLGNIFTPIINKYTVTVSCIGYDSLPISGVAVIVAGTVTTPTEVPPTNSAGLTSFQANWGTNFTVSVQKSGCVFIDPLLPVSNITANTALSFTTRAPAPFTLDGTVIMAEGGAPLENVTITAGTRSGTTDNTGYYSFTVYEGESFYITPSLIGYQFNPAPFPIAAVASDITQNFTASIAIYNVGGVVMNAGVPLSGVTVTLNGTITNTTTTDGTFNFTLPHGSAVSIVPTATGYTFTPGSFTVNPLLSPHTNLVFEAGPLPCLISGYVALDYPIGYALDGFIIYDMLSTRYATTDAFGLYSMQVFYGDSVKLYAEKHNYTFSPPFIELLNISSDLDGNGFTATAVCDTVTFSLDSGVYYEPITVALSTTPLDASIYYTLDGSTPTPTSESILYTGPITIPSHTDYIIRAMATKDHFAPSAVTQRTFSVTGNAYRPTIALESGVFYEAIWVTITPPTGLPTLPPGSEPFRIYYTTNGQTPTHTDAVYDYDEDTPIPIFINKNTYLQAVVMRPNYLVPPEAVAMAYYEIRHMMELDFTDTIYLNINTNLTVNIANYLADSVIGEHIYTVTVLQPPTNINLNIFDHTYMNIAPRTDWFGTESFTVKIDFIPTPLPVSFGAPYRPNINFATDMLYVTVNPSGNDPGGILRGTVTYAGSPLPGATVSIIGAGGISSTNERGEYSIQGIVQGVYSITATKEGYEPYTYGNVAINSGGVTTHNISMSPVSDSDIVQPPAEMVSLINYPNPFNPETNIQFELSDDSNITLGVYNVKGQLIEQLFGGRLNKGVHRLLWDASSQASGIYFVALQSEGGCVIHKMVLMK